MDDDLPLHLLNSENTESAYKYFHEKYLFLLNKYAPLRKLTKKENKLKQNPWMTQGILKSISKKRKLFKKFKCSKLRDKDSNATYKNYKSYNDMINKLIKKCKRDYYQQYFQTHMKNSKMVWTGINKLLKRSKRKQRTIYLEENNALVSNPQKVANRFNAYFLNVAENLCSKIPLVEEKFDDYLKNRKDVNWIMEETTPDEIVKIVNDLDVKKSSDIYNISPELVKLSGPAVSHSLSIIFNMSIKEGCFPSAMKLAKIVPLHKGDSVLNVSNYRPISLLPIFSKIFERLIYNRLIKFIDDNHVLSKFQFGFQKNKSTEQAVTSIINHIHCARDNGQSAYCIFLDFAKAFDTVNHEILLAKLKHYGILGKPLKLLESYLKNRSQRTEVDGVLSDEGTIIHGVPQSSVLGPLLFLLYINDICESSNIFKFFLFADDT